MAQRLETERLVLRPWTGDDAEAALRAYGDAEVARWLAPAMDQVGDQAAMRVVLQQWIAEDERMLTPAGRWAVESRRDGRLIGGATLLPRPPDDEYEIGWQLQRDAWGHGYAPEGAAAAMDWAFDNLGWETIIHSIAPDNLASQAVARKLGSSLLGPGRLPEPYHEKPIELWGQTREQWRKRRAGS